MSFVYAPSSGAGNTSTTHAGASFTASNGNGTATASTLTLSIPGATTAASWADFPKLTKNAIENQMRLDYRVRIAAASGGNGDTWFQMGLRKSDGSQAFMMQTNGGTGAVDGYDSSSLVFTSAGLFSFGGDEWLRVTNRDGFFTYWTGLGGEPDEVEWTIRARSISTNIPSGQWEYSYLTLHLYQGSGAAGTVSIQWADVITQVLL